MSNDNNSIQDVCSKLIKKVEKYETSDYELHSSMSAAMSHQTSIEKAKLATEMLVDGKSIGEILKWAEIKVIDDILYKVTKDSKLVISYWQCRDNPGYSPVEFTNHMRIYCYGDAGSWSGSYGNEVEISCLVRYAKENRSILSPQN